MAETVFDIRDLRVRFSTPDGTVHAVNGVDLSINEGEATAVVGESGSGKSQLFLASLGLLSSNGRAEGSVKFRNREILGLAPKALNRIRGMKISMVFQDPMTSLTPHMRIGDQIAEVLRVHKNVGGAEARSAVLHVLDAVKIPEARKRMRQYPHELSGGMRQRVMIAMALIGKPDLIIADEPTTALDVTVQAEIMKLFSEIRQETGTAIVLITHDLGLVGGLCDRANVMYAGRIVERGRVDDLLTSPRHPYTYGLIQSIPKIEAERGERIVTIPGQPPDPLVPIGDACSFHPRCPNRIERCTKERPTLRSTGPGREATCFNQVTETVQ